MTHKNMRKKIVSIISLVLLFAISFTLLGGTKISYENIKKGVTNLFAKNEQGEPIHEKLLKDNGDGTYNLSLSVTGDSEKKVNKANVVVIIDISGSMNETATSYTYTKTNSTSGTLYGLYNGQYVRIYYRNNNWRLSDSRYGTIYSGDRYTRTESSETRIAAAKNAVNNLGNALLANNNKDGNPSDTIEMALISFSNTANVEIEKTTSYSVFSSKVNGLTAVGGTNWEDALQKVNDVTFNNDGDTTYVIFVSDGNPTFRNNVGNYYMSSYNNDDYYTRDDGSWYGASTFKDYRGYYDSNGSFYGWGNENWAEGVRRCYNEALDEARAIVSSGKTFFTIGAYGDVSRMSGLTTDAGAPAKNYYSASDTEELETALNDILNQIQTAGFGEVEITDGTTKSVTATSGELSGGMLDIDTSSYKYWLSFPINEENGTLTSNVTYITNITSNGGNSYTLTGKDGKTFDVVRVDDLDSNGDVRTNSFKFEWKSSGNDNNPLHTENPPTAKLDESGTSVVWDLSSLDVLLNDVTYTVTFDVWPSQVTLDLIADLKNDSTLFGKLPENVQKSLVKNGNDYQLKTNTNATLSYDDTRTETNEDDVGYVNPDPVSTVSSELMAVSKVYEDYLNNTKPNIKLYVDRGSEVGHYKVDLNKDNNYTNNVNISVGIMVVDEATGTVTLKTTGHDYKFSEDNETAYNWELKGDISHPMLINNVVTMLVKVENAPSGMTGDYYNDNGTKYYKINGSYYKATKTGAASLTATNTRRGYMDVVKTVDGADAPSDALFTYNVKFTTGDSKDIWFSIWDGKKLIRNTSSQTYITGATEEDGETGYYYAKSGSEITIKLQAGWGLRFLNLPVNTKYEITESSMPENFIFGNIVGEKTVHTSETEKETSNEGTINGQRISGTILTNNTEYKVTFNNIYTKTHVDVLKVWSDTNNQDGIRPTSVEVKLLKNGQETNQTLTLNQGNEWQGTFSDLDAYENGNKISYTVTETLTDKITGQDAAGTYKFEITESQAGGYIITNTHTPELRNITVKKNWDDSDNQDGLRKNINVTLYNGDTVIGRAELNDSNDWSKVFENVPKYASGSIITYRADEDSVPDGYEKTVGTMTDDGVIEITNTHNPETINITATKVWNDSDNQDGKRTEVVFHLNKQLEGETTKTIVEGQDKTISLTGNREVTWENLAAYEGGKKITYTVTEEEVDGYTTEVTGDMETGFTVTNTHNPETINITATKVWNDSDNQDGKRKEVVFHLNKQLEGETTKTIVEGQDKTISLTGNREVTWENLAAYEGGKKITYTVTEEEIDGYTTEVTGDMETGFTVTNTHNPETINITATKVWNDSDNQDGKRKEVVFHLNKQLEGETTKTIVEGQDKTISLTGNRKVTWENLAAYEGGKKITYTVTEEEIDGYTTEVTGDMEAGFTVTNTHNPETINITATKVWNDSDNQDGKRKEVVFHLNKQLEGETTKTIVEGQDKTISLTGNRKVTWENLAAYEGGKKITYTVTEEEIDGYTTEVTGDMETGFIVTNTHGVNKTSVTVTKKWEDANNQDGIRPANVTVELLANGSSLKTKKEVVLSASNNWTYTFTDLDENLNGTKIKYTVEEKLVDNLITLDDDKNAYKVEITGSAESGYTITNTHIPETTKLDVEKIWNDDNDRDKKRPGSITVVLDADQEIKEKGQTLVLNSETVNDEGNWIGSFTNLPKNHAGVEINYSLKELKVDGYDNVEISEIVDGKITITNTHKILTKNITVEKIWQDNNNEDKTRPDSITIILKANGDEYARKEILKEGYADNENWSCTFDNLPVNDQGKEIIYTVDELDVSGYDKTVADNYKIYNSSNKKISISGEKTWVDDGDRDGARPESITIRLYADGVEINSKTVTAKDEWKYDFGELPKYKAGQPITYSISEDAVEGYSTKINNYDVTNTHKLETVNISGTKRWEDDDDRDKIRPESIIVNLYANGGETPVDQATVIPDEDGNWNFEFKDKLKYENKKEIVYTVEEESVEGYEPVVNANEGLSFEIVNNHTPETIEFNITKNWDDYEDEDGIRPESITIRLYADGVEIDSFEMTEANNWTYSSKTLPRYKKHDGTDKQEIVYTITEDEIEGYGSTIDTAVVINDDNKGKVINNSITNSHMPQITIEGEKTWEDFDNEYNSRPKEITIYLYKKDELYKTITVTSETDWKYVIENLDKYEDGEEITYTIREEEVEGYETIYDGYNILNKIIWNMGDGTEELPPQTGILTGIEISFNNVLYVIISGVLFILGSYLKHEESK